MGKGQHLSGTGRQELDRGLAGLDQDLDGFLAERGIPLIPNRGLVRDHVDDTDYSLTAGIFAEGFSDPTFHDDRLEIRRQPDDGALFAKSKIVILPELPRVRIESGHAKVLARELPSGEGSRTYLFYFSKSTLQLVSGVGSPDLSAAETTAATVDNLLRQRRISPRFRQGFRPREPNHAIP